MLRFKYQILFGAAALLALPVGAADAGILPGYQNQLQFDNREIVLDNDGNSTLTAGDQIIGVLQMNTINTPLGPQPTTPEVTGVFDLTVAYVIAVAGNADGIAGGTVIDPTALGGYDGTAVVLFGATAIDGTILSLYEGGPADVQATLDDPGKTTADVFAAASDGTLLGTFGLGGAAVTPGDWGTAGVGYWAGVVDYSAGATSPFSSFYYGLELLGGPMALYGAQPLLNTQINAGGALGTLGTGIANTTSITSNAAGGSIFFDLVGKGSQIPNDAGASTTLADQAKFPIFSQDPATLHPNTPEPGSMILALLGVGCAAPFVRRRRKSKEQAA